MKLYQYLQSTGRLPEPLFSQERAVQRESEKFPFWFITQSPGDVVSLLWSLTSIFPNTVPFMFTCKKRTFARDFVSQHEESKRRRPLLCFCHTFAFCIYLHVFLPNKLFINILPCLQKGREMAKWLKVWALGVIVFLVESQLPHWLPVKTSRQLFGTSIFLLENVNNTAVRIK